jgi:hypothetical protein
MGAARMEDSSPRQDTSPLIYCYYCGLQVEHELANTMNGVGMDGEEILLELYKVRCPAGHWYNVAGEEVGL